MTTEMTSDSGWEKLRQVGRPRLLVLDPDAIRGADLVRLLGPTLEARYVSSDDLRLSDGAIDVIVVRVSDQALDMVSTALAFHGTIGRPELVFVTDGHSSPESEAMKAAGIRHLVPHNEAIDWLTEMCEPLSQLARARRVMQRAQAELVAGTSATTPPLPLPLPVAERAFRETYLRCLSAIVPSRSEAARQARVPYRTFCHMLKKLCIATDGDRRLSRQP